MNAEPTIEALRRFFASHPDGIDAAYLFGSVARGQARADSDVDVGILLSAGPPQALADFDGLADLQVRLTDLLGREVDLVPRNAAAPDLLHRML